MMVETPERVTRYGTLGLIACRLVEALKDGKAGDVKTDAELAAIAGGPVGPGDKFYGGLRSAQRYVLLNLRLQWERVKGEHCIKCYSSAESMLDAKQDVRSIRRAANRTVHKTLAVRIDEVPPERRADYGATVAQIGAIAAMTAPQVRRQLEATTLPALDWQRLIQDAIGKKD